MNDAPDHNLPIPTPTSSTEPEQFELTERGEQEVARTERTEQCATLRADRTRDLAHIFALADETARVYDIGQLRRAAASFLDDSFDTINIMRKGVLACSDRELRDAFARIADAWQYAQAAALVLCPDAE